VKLLIITEKPSVAVDLSKELPGKFIREDGYLEGPIHIVTWAYGHLLELAMPEEYNPGLKKWDINTLPILPNPFRFRPKESTRKQLNIIRTLVNRKDVNRLINACDAGREGELVFRQIIQYLDCRKPHDRLWLAETTPAAVRNAFANLRTSAEVDNLAQAAIARSQADWLVGINATRGFTVQNGEKLTVGRVQTPTLGLIVERERAIEGFVPTPYWEIEAEFETDKGKYKAKWNRGDQDRFVDKSHAEAVLTKLIPNSPGIVTNLDQKETRELPPQLLNLNELQKEANKRFGMTAQKTLDVAQKLYENHLITYPRTDSRHLTQAMAETLPARLNALRRTEIGAIVASLTGATVTDKRYIDDSKVTDHTAIIVTESSPNMAELRGDEKNIYMLVARRMVGIFLPPAKYLITEAITTCQDETFISKGKVVLKAGWKVLYEQQHEEQEGEKDANLPPLTLNQPVTLSQAAILDKQTQPPKRYTEADLLSVMENIGKQIDDEALQEAMKGRGLGTPATRAAIIEKLISVGYIVRKKKVLVPTEKGRYLIDIVMPELKSPELTAVWEEKLTDIEQGRYASMSFMREIHEFTASFVSKLKKQEPVKKVFTAGSLGNCPICGKPVVEGKKGFGCSGWKEGCKFTIWKEIAGRKITEAQVRKLLQSGKTAPLKGFKSKAGKEFEACLKVEGGKVVFEFPPKKAVGK